MITYEAGKFTERPVADQTGDCSLGNILFYIASTIGIAVKNGYSFGFPEWNNSKFFANPLPEVIKYDFPRLDVGWGFNGFNVLDNVSLLGYMQSEKYFEHCPNLIRYYLTLKDLAEPIKDTIFIHYRNCIDEGTLIYPATRDYYLKALTFLPKKEVVVITDNIEKARQVIGLDCRYISSTPIMDFYLLSHAHYLVMSPSSFSWWAAWLSQAVTVAPPRWFATLDEKDLYCKRWITW